MHEGHVRQTLALSAALAVIFFPGAAAALNIPPAVSSVTFSPTPVTAGGNTLIQCAAGDDSSIVRMRIDVRPTCGSATILFASDVAITQGPAVSGTLAWVPPAEGSYCSRCQVWDDGVGGSFGAKTGWRDEPVTVLPRAGNPPIIDGLTASATEVLPGATVQLNSAARDPDGDPLTYTWSATTGTLVPSGASATWTAAGTTGGATITLRVSDGTGNEATRAVAITVRIALWGGAMPVRLVSPVRVSLAATGDFYVVDGASGQLALLTPRGELKALLGVPGIALSVTECWGEVIAGLAEGPLQRLSPYGKSLGQLTVAGAPLASPTGLACDPVTGLLLIAEHSGARVRAVRQDGSLAFTLTQAGADRLVAPSDVAIDVIGRRIWVVLDSNQAGAAQQLHSFRFDGSWDTSSMTYGGSAGRLTRGSGLAVGPAGKLYVADAFQSTVTVLDATGAPVGELGGFGTVQGRLKVPQGIAVHQRGDVVVANSGNNRLEFYGNGQALPGCPGDTDCDGLPDFWELANGLNLWDPRDALADPDGDGLPNLQELALGTNPKNRDTDGDGFSDGEELALGQDPRVPDYQPPALVVLSTPDSDPGLVRLDAQLQGRGSCSVTWTQNQGPTVALRDATTPTPSFVARLAGSYAFSGTPSCGPVSGPPATASATVRDLPPRTDPGRLVVVPSGESFLLEGSFSWDPNGTALSFLWEQTLGPPRLAAAQTADTWVRAHQPGLYAFQLGATDATTRTFEAEVPVLVVAANRSAPTTLVDTPVTGKVGDAISLDASDSVGPPGAALQFAWRQVLGPAAALRHGQPGQAAFLARHPGHYRFEVSARDAAFESPWAAIDAYVAVDAAGLPVAVTDPVRAGTVGEPLTLSGVQSRGVALGASLTYRWRQVSGPPAGLTNANQPSATVVPFSPGVARFALVVKEGAMESLPALVTVESDVPGKVRPVARAAGPAVTTAASEVVLDGLGSSGAGGTLRYRWTQVAGPWVPLDDPRGAVAAFTPRLPGLYVFELEVDDGGVRSGPASVGVLVFPQGAGGRP